MDQLETTPAVELRLSDFLRTHQDDIVALWTERARELPPARKVSNLGIMDDLPLILARIADVVAVLDDDARGAMDEGPIRHALDRLGRGFDLSEVIREYALLRLVILERWQQQVGAHIDVAEVKALDQAIDQAIELSSVRFADARQRILRALDRISEAPPRPHDLKSYLGQLLEVTLQSMEAVDTGVVSLREEGGLRPWATVGLDADRGGRPLRAEFRVPLRHAGQDVGIAHVGSTTAFEFSDDDQLLFRTMASRAAAAIVESRLRDLEFRTLADNIPQLAWMADETGSAFWFNQRWFDYTGLTLEQAKGWGWQQLQDPEHTKRVAEKAREHVKTGEPWEDTFSLRGRDGRYRWFLSRASPIRDTSGRVTRWFGTNTDISREREAIRQRDEILAIVSHDLRNPLGTIQVNAAVLAESLPAAATDPLLQKHVEGIQRSANRMKHLINDLLDLANIRAGHLTVDPADDMVGPMLEEALEAHLPTAAGKGIVLRAEIESVRGLRIRADRDRLLQVLGNLIGNAIKFCLPGDRITLSATPGPDQIQFGVEDTGPGIPELDQSRMFELYWSGEGEARRSTGLGLYISKEIVQAHGGRIWAESKLGAGSRFWFTIPLAR